MLSNYVGNAGSLTREVGRIYWKKALGSECPLEIYNNKVYMDFTQSNPGGYIYNFPSGPKTLQVGQSLNITCDFALYTGNSISEGCYYSKDGAIRFGLFNSNNYPVTIDGLSNSGQLFRNYEGYITTLSTSKIKFSGTCVPQLKSGETFDDDTAFAIRVRYKDPTPYDGTNPTDLSGYGRLINSIGNVSSYSPSGLSPTGLNAPISEANKPLSVSNAESINNGITYYKYSLTVNRINTTGCRITSSVKSGESFICTTTYTHNFNNIPNSNYYTFDNFVFRCNSSTVEQAIIKDLTIT